MRRNAMKNNHVLDNIPGQYPDAVIPGQYLSSMPDYALNCILNDGNRGAASIVFSVPFRCFCK